MVTQKLQDIPVA